jgi:outer membrane immunogenic protein
MRKLLNRKGVRMAEIRGPVRKVALALLATCCVAAFGPQSLGADLGIAPKAPPVVAPFQPWAGGYFGSFIGFGWGNVLDATTLTSKFDHYIYNPYSSSSSLADTDASSMIAGSVFGYNWQSGRFVYGIEADITRTDISADSGSTKATVVSGYGSAFAGGDAMTSIDWYGTLRARGGVILNERWMVYATGGLAYGKVDLHGGVGLGGSTGPGQPYSLLSGFHGSSIKAGWVVGAGIEWQHPFDLPLIRGATVSLAYQYVDLGSVSTTQVVSITGSDGTASAILNAKADAAFHVVRVGAAWRMGDAPVGRGGGYSAVPGWAGFYVGGHAGGIWSAGEFLEPVSTTASYSGWGSSTHSGGSSSPSSGFFGAQGGYNWQSGAWVYGFELDGSVTNLDASSANVTARYANVIAVGEAGASLSWITSVRARMGYAFDRMLVYGTAGAAGGKVNFRGSVNTGGYAGLGGGDLNKGSYASFDESSIEYGWTAGGGIDYQIRPDLIANFGYQYVDLGTVSAWTRSGITNTGTGLGTVNASTDLTFHMFRVGLSYRN